MKIGLLFGGKSFEHDISIVTAGLVYYALKDKYELYPLYIGHDGIFYYTKEIEAEKFYRIPKKKIQFINGGFKNGLHYVKLDIMIGLMHGLNGEDGVAAVLCNLYNICYLGSHSTGAGICLDKYYTYSLLKINNIKVINSQVLTRNKKPKSYKYPLIIKPARLGSSIGIKVCDKEEELNVALEEAFKYDERVVIQTFYSDAVEFNQALFKSRDDLVLSNIEIVKKTDNIYSFKDKYLKQDLKRSFVEDKALIDAISTISKKVYTLLNLSGIVRIDYLFIDGTLYVNEINTTPGSLAYYLFDLDFKELLEMNMKEAIINYNKMQSYYYPSSVLSHLTIIKK